MKQDDWIMHKGLINVSDTVVYILGWVSCDRRRIDVLGVNSRSGTIVAVGLAFNWIGIILAFFSGVIGNRKIPPGYEER